MDELIKAGFMPGMGC